MCARGGGYWKDESHYHMSRMAFSVFRMYMNSSVCTYAPPRVIPILATSGVFAMEDTNRRSLQMDTRVRVVCPILCALHTYDK